MTKSKRIQVMADEALMEQVDHYVKENGVSHSQAGKALMLLGYRLWQQQGDSELSIMDALKLLLESSYGLQILFNSTANKHLAKSNNDEGDPYPTAPLIQAAHRLATEKVDGLFKPQKKT